MNDKTILITGGAGFIGSNLVCYLLAHYPAYKLVVLDALTYAGSPENLPDAFLSSDSSRYQFWTGDVCNAELVDTLVGESNIVVHLAAETHVTRSIDDNLIFYQTDVIGTHTVANAVLKAHEKIDRFIHVSTSEVYGTALESKMNEEHPLNPMSPYASAKCGADRLVYSYWETYRIPAVIVRPFNNFGPRQHLEKVIPRFITSVWLDEPMTIHGDGTASRDFIFVEDVCRALDLLIHAPLGDIVGKTFNVATGVDRTILGIAKDIARLMGRNTESVEFQGDRLGQVRRHTGDSSKIYQAVGWEPETTWEDGLRRTIEWYENHRVWWNRQRWMRKISVRTVNGEFEEH